MSFDFIGMYSTKSIWSVITDKDTDKCEYMFVIRDQPHG